MPTPPIFRIVLAKEDFKFSSAHFTVFNGERAELLHGHNYQVTVELAGSELDGWGLLVDLDRVKTVLRDLCGRLDSRTLVPGESASIRWLRQGGDVEVRYGERAYRFPADDVLVLPLANTSIELLARLLWTDLAAHLGGSRVERMAVSVEESAGQRCFYEAALEA
ncbi:MAG TPA: 6-carboxytetrahydropterin synthase [Thermoanaerobaculia bacterium]|nr:6-carboxytetrahydropterin synthase [Thermoanaerobaculia bacterium]